MLAKNKPVIGRSWQGWRKGLSIKFAGQINREIVPFRRGWLLTRSGRGKAKGAGATNSRPCALPEFTRRTVGLTRGCLFPRGGSIFPCRLCPPRLLRHSQQTILTSNHPPLGGRPVLAVFASGSQLGISGEVSNTCRGVALAPRVFFLLRTYFPFGSVLLLSMIAQSSDCERPIITYWFFKIAENGSFGGVDLGFP